MHAVERDTLPKVDVTHEAEQVEAAATALDVPLPTVCGEISRSGGNLRAALVMLSSQSPTQQQRPRSRSAISAGVCAAGGASNSRQQHQRQVSQQDLGVRSLSRPGSTPLVDPQDPQVATTKAHVSGPIGPSPGAAPGRGNFGSSDGGCSRAASQQAGVTAALPPLPAGRQAASSGFESSAAPSAAGSVSNMHSRVSSFDVLSVGAPWSELLSNTTRCQMTPPACPTSKASGAAATLAVSGSTAALSSHLKFCLKRFALFFSELLNSLAIAEKRNSLVVPFASPTRGSHRI